MIRQLGEWAHKTRSDAAWVRDDRWRALTSRQRETFPPLYPDAVFEVRSRTDSVDELRVKMQSFRTNGAIIGILINPYDRFVELYRPDVTATLPYRIALDPELPGLVIELHALD